MGMPETQVGGPDMVLALRTTEALRAVRRRAAGDSGAVGGPPAAVTASWSACSPMSAPTASGSCSPLRRLSLDGEQLAQPDLFVPAGSPLRSGPTPTGGRRSQSHPRDEVLSPSTARYEPRRQAAPGTSARGFGVLDRRSRCAGGSERWGPDTSARKSRRAPRLAAQPEHPPSRSTCPLASARSGAKPEPM